MVRSRAARRWPTTYSAERPRPGAGAPAGPSRGLMPVSLYMDHHVPRAITAGLRLRGVDVLTAAEDGAAELADPDLLDRAAVLGRVLFSQDEDSAGRRRRGGRLKGSRSRA